MKIRYSSFPIWLLGLLVAAVFVGSTGHRLGTVGTDTPVYVSYFNKLLVNIEVPVNFEYVFKSISLYLASMQLSVTSFFSLIAMIQASFIYWLVHEIDLFTGKKTSYYRLLFLVWICLLWSPFFFSMVSNVIRQGMSVFALLCFFLLMSSCIAVCPNSRILRRARRIDEPANNVGSLGPSTEIRVYGKLLLFLLLSVSFHYSSIIYIPFSLMLFFSYSTVLMVSLVLGVSYMTGFSENMVQMFSALTHLDIYGTIMKYGNDVGFFGGIRKDFAIFTISSGLFFHFISSFFLANDDKVTFRKLLKIFWALSMPFFCVGFFSFSGRFLLPPWLFLSILTAVFTNYVFREYYYFFRYCFVTFVLSCIYFSCKMLGMI